MLVSSVVDHGFKPRSGQTKDHKIGIWCFSAKHTALRRKSKDHVTSPHCSIKEFQVNNSITTTRATTPHDVFSDHFGGSVTQAQQNWNTKIIGMMYFSSLLFFSSFIDYASIDYAFTYYAFIDYAFIDSAFIVSSPLSLWYYC
jgi:hypothetical protein